MIDRKTFAAALCGFSFAAGGAVALHAATTPAPKAYVVGEIEVKDLETYKTYAAQTPAIIAKHGGAYLARGGQTVPLEGSTPASRVVVIEFPSLAAARTFEDSPEYRAIAPTRQRAATSRLFIVEGVSR
jgi:uncharacterized protein (DUF1330 family)